MPTSRKSMTELTVKESFVPICMVTVLFFLWGFAYGLLDVLNAHFQAVLNITKGQSSGLQGAYYGAYAIAPLTISGYVVRRWGYRITFMFGLSIFGVGCLLFWPSGVYYSFLGFCGSMFVVGFGLATLETAANPFVSICGPPEHMEKRLNITQSFQAIGTVVAPLLAAHVFFTGPETKESLKNVQWVYLGVGIFVFCLAFTFFWAPIPEASDADMQLQTSDEDVGPLRKQIRLFLGVVAEFCYVGAQVALAGYFINYCEEAGRSSSTSSNLLAVAQSMFAIGRFFSSFIMQFVKPRVVLLFAIVGCAISIMVGMNVDGTIGIVALNICFFCESCCFPTIFTLSLKRLGIHTKRGGSFLVSAVCGGAIFPVMLGQVADQKSTHFAMIIPFAGYCIAALFPIFVNFHQRQRQQIDYVEEDNLKHQADAEMGGGELGNVTTGVSSQAETELHD